MLDYVHLEEDATEEEQAMRDSAREFVAETVEILDLLAKEIGSDRRIDDESPS